MREPLHFRMMYGIQTCDTYWSKPIFASCRILRLHHPQLTKIRSNLILYVSATLPYMTNGWAGGRPPTCMQASDAARKCRRSQFRTIRHVSHIYLKKHLTTCILHTAQDGWRSRLRTGTRYIVRLRMMPLLAVDVNK